MGATFVEQQIAEESGKQRHTVHCPEWLDDRMCPTGAKGGYRFLIERGNQWAIKLLRGVANRPTIFVELRSYFLHTHARGIMGAVEEACACISEVLLSDMEAMRLINPDTARCSCLDLHADWQGDDDPTFEAANEKLFCIQVACHPTR